MTRNIGIIGLGIIAETMAKTVKQMPDVKLVAVGSRTRDKADSFAKKYKVEKAYGSYEELVKDPEVDLVYIATPHSRHYEDSLLCLKNHKPVLCEKAFMANAKQAKDIIEYADKEKVFITEAIWTRYLPFLEVIKKELASGIIGKPCTLTANLGYKISQINRLTDPSLAGGALLDVGVYPLNFASMIFGDEIADITSKCTYTSTGVDETDSMTLIYKDGKMAVLNCTMSGISDRKGIIYGDKGYMIAENINNYESLEVFDETHEMIKHLERENQISGYEYEVEASFKAIEQGKTECDEMSHAETIRMMEVMDELRKQWGIVYPFEK